MLELTLRLIFSLAVVVGMLLLLARLASKRFRGGPDALVQVVQRQALSRTTAVSVVTVGSRVLVLGTTEQQITVLAELDPDELVTEIDVPEGADADAEDAQQSARPSYDVAASTAVPTGALTGSLLSPDTWRRTLAALSAGAGARGADSR